MDVLGAVEIGGVRGLSDQEGGSEDDDGDDGGVGNGSVAGAGVYEAGEFPGAEGGGEAEERLGLQVGPDVEEGQREKFMHLAWPIFASGRR